MDELICAKCAKGKTCTQWCGGGRFANNDGLENYLRHVKCPQKRAYALLWPIEYSKDLRKVSKDDEFQTDVLALIAQFSGKGDKRLVRNVGLYRIDIGQVGAKFVDFYVRACVEFTYIDGDAPLQGFCRCTIDGGTLRIAL